MLSNMVLLYPGLGISFLQMTFTGITTAPYPYAIIPLAEVVFLTFVNYYDVKSEVQKIGRISVAVISRIES